MIAMEKKVPSAELAELETPIVPYNTHEAEYQFHWFNSLLRLYGDSYEDYLRYLPDDKALKVPDGLQTELLDKHFPFSYFPTELTERYWYHPGGLAEPQYAGKYEPLQVDRGDEEYPLKWTNTVMRLYGESNFNHVEVRVGGQIKGLMADELVWRHLFENDFPMLFLPSIDMDLSTKQWFEAQEDDGA